MLCQASVNDSIEEKFHPPDAPTDPKLGHATSATAAPSRVSLSVGGMTCASCSGAITRALEELPGVSEVAVNLLGNSATLVVSSTDIVPTVVAAIEDIGYEAEIVGIEPIRSVVPQAKASGVSEQQGGPQRVALSVDGMTCASCSNTVTRLLSEVPGVSEVSVNLLGKSATAVIQDADLAPQLVEAVNDAGYEAEIVGLQPLHAVDVEDVGPRTISLRVGGMFCA